MCSILLIKVFNLLIYFDEYTLQRSGSLGFCLETHPRLDIIIGEDLTNGRIYGYSTLDFAYIMYEPAGNQWFSVPPRQYKNSNDSGHLYRDKILLPNCVYVDERRNEEMFPMQNSRMEVGSKTFASMLFC